jgi:hypothetical protein
MSENWLTEYLLGKGGRIGMPNALDLFLRANNINKSLGDLWIPPLAVPVIVINTSTNVYPNPKKIVLQDAQYGVGPMVDTPVWSYTAPARRNLLIEEIQVDVERVTVAGVAGIAQIYVEYNKNPLIRAHVSINLTGIEEPLMIGSSIVVFAGDTIECHTVDNSTGGTCNYVSNMIGTEYDAPA